MTAEPAFDHALERTVTAVQAITEWDVDQLDMDLDELAEAWLTLDEARKQLAVLANDLAVNVGSKLADMPYERKEGYVLPSGQIIHHAQASRVKWKGRQLVVDLSTQLVDPDTGETQYAIPTDVLLDIIPGTATDKLTSSTWRIGGLSNLGVDPDDYRTREWLPPKAQKGPGR